jgi:phenylalanyl-tRNA synthetase beta chain
VGEVNLARVLAGGRSGAAYRPVPRFPVVPFDVAVVVPRRVPAAEVARVLRESAPDAVRDVDLFDVYEPRTGEGAGIPAGSKSLAFTLVFVDETATISPKAAEVLRARVLQALGARGWTVRTADASA